MEAGFIFLSSSGTGAVSILLLLPQLLLQCRPVLHADALIRAHREQQLAAALLAAPARSAQLMVILAVLSDRLNESVTEVYTPEPVQKCQIIFAAFSPHGLRGVVFPPCSGG